MSIKYIEIYLFSQFGIASFMSDDQQPTGFRNSLYHRNKKLSAKESFCLFLLGVIFFSGIFVIFHFREAKLDKLEVNSIAESYLVAEMDFEFLDEEFTNRLKVEALRDIEQIYKIPKREVYARQLEFESILFNNQKWRKLVKYATFEEMSKVSIEFAQTLINTRFTDARTLQKMKELHLSIINYEIFSPYGDLQAVTFPQQVWINIEKMAFSKGVFHSGTKSFILNHFKKRFWRLEVDEDAIQQLTKVIKETVPDRYTQVNSGDRIIDKGEKVTQRHVAMISALKRSLDERRNLSHPLTLLGTFILSLVFTVIAYLYMSCNFASIVRSVRKMFLVITITLLTMGLAKFAEYLTFNNPTSLIEDARFPILAPFAAILITILLGSRLAMFVGGYIAILLSMSLGVDRISFLVMNIITVFAVVLSLKTVCKRKEVFIVCAKAWCVAILVILSLNLYDQTVWILADFTSTLFYLAVTAILVVGFLPLLESLFSIMTDVTLMEYMDPNHELLRRLSIEAPGTYQHSIVVGNLSETAALAIGANGLFCRVSCLYHDIGKLITPHYFTENQQGGINMHHLLTPLESAQVIIAHVTEGLLMAHKAHLPEPFIDIIREHHGDTLVYYFYRKQCELMGDDRALVNEDDFRYPGPRPLSKESAIIMIADSLEAASRSLDELCEQTVTELVESIVSEKAKAGQFEYCQLTFEELGIAKKAMIKTLVAAGHSRVKYPKKDS
jgi:cyclic-di-AMP phosphodiesterase PgpH